MIEKMRDELVFVIDEIRNECRGPWTSAYKYADKLLARLADLGIQVEVEEECGVYKSQTMCVSNCISTLKCDGLAGTILEGFECLKDGKITRHVPLREVLRG